MRQKATLFLFVIFWVLSACQNPPPNPESIEIPAPSSTPTAPDLPTSTAVSPTATSQPTPTLSAPETIEARIHTLAAQFTATYPVNSGWLYRRETLYEPTASDTAYTYRNLGNDWVYELWIQPDSDGHISQQIMHVYDDAGGLWERSAILGSHNITVLPEQTLEDPVAILDKPVPYRTAHQDIIALLSQPGTGNASAWEENGRYHIQLLTPASRAIFSFDIETGAFLQQRLWQLNSDGRDSLLIDVHVVETAVVTQLPPPAAQTILDARALLANTQN